MSCNNASRLGIGSDRRGRADRGAVLLWSGPRCPTGFEPLWSVLSLWGDPDLRQEHFEAQAFWYASLHDAGLQVRATCTRLTFYGKACIYWTQKICITSNSSWKTVVRFQKFWKGGINYKKLISNSEIKIDIHRSTKGPGDEVHMDERINISMFLIVSSFRNWNHPSHIFAIFIHRNRKHQIGRKGDNCFEQI